MSNEKLTDEECITDERLGYLLGIFERKRWDLFQYADVQVSTEIALAELRAHRQAALTAEDVEALRWLRSYGGTSLRFMEGQSDKAMDTMGRALAILDRLTTEQP